MTVLHALNLSKGQVAPMLAMDAHDTNSQHDDKCREKQCRKEMG